MIRYASHHPQLEYTPFMSISRHECRNHKCRPNVHSTSLPIRLDKTTFELVSHVEYLERTVLVKI